MQKSFFEIWTGSTLNKFRKCHIKGDRSMSPCNTCNADGTVYGKKHFKKFKKDKHSNVGLLRAVNKRKKLLDYLKKNNVDSYKNLLNKLNLRK